MTPPKYIGIDPQTDRMLVARATADESGSITCSVEVHPGGNPLDLPADTPIAVAVPDHEVAVKLIYLPPGSSPDFLSRASFELSQAVLEPPDTFQFDALATPIRDRFIGFSYRRERLNVLKTRLLAGQNGALPEPRFLMRAVALGHGYGRFAQAESDGLLCLADLAGGMLSLCFLYDRMIVAVAHMTVGTLDPTDDRSMRAFGLDLKSLINYHLAACAQHGLSVPLSAVVTCGRLAEPQILDSLTPLFSARIVKPQLQTDGVHFESTEESVRFPDSLAALGLTLN